MTATTFVPDVDFERLAHWYTFGAEGKYRALRTYQIQTDFRPAHKLTSKFGLVVLNFGGSLVISGGYVWDGASGPTWDTPATMRASLVHDALYQLMRERDLDAGESRAPADRLLRSIMITDGAWPTRTSVWLLGVRLFAASAARAKKRAGNGAAA